MVYIFIFYVFRIEIVVCKQYRPWSDAAFCGVWSGTAFVYVPKIVRNAWKEMVQHSDSAGINQKKWRIDPPKHDHPPVGRTWLLTYWWDTKLFLNARNGAFHQICRLRSKTEYVIIRCNCFDYPLSQYFGWGFKRSILYKQCSVS